MTVDYGAQWVAYVTKLPVSKVRELFSDDQLVLLGQKLEANRLLNPPKPKKAKKRLGVFKCKCCGTYFQAEYTTKPPQFLNDAHRMRYWRAKWADERLAEDE